MSGKEKTHKKKEKRMSGQIQFPYEYHQAMVQRDENEINNNQNRIKISCCEAFALTAAATTASFLSLYFKHFSDEDIMMGDRTVTKILGGACAFFSLSLICIPWLQAHDRYHDTH